VPGIYVHAKVMIVDDIFVSVGSTNIARRSFGYDGEINAFAVPQRLSRDPDNPARRLRCMLWAEHLGLPPELGFTLLADPHSALDFFDRDWYDGCRWQRLYPQTPERPSSSLVLPNYDARIKTEGGSLFSAILNATPGVLEEVYRKTIWNAVVDPTTNLDPHFNKGPEYPGS
jgi:phosphatidylserine/phosphatidylglycerophosphate/cardiolipin synthase-like enzyme